jgi:ribosomal protein S18 acetylase RimI-like enzyme
VELTIRRGLEPRHRAAAAAIFEDAFGHDQRMTVPDPAKRLRFLEAAIDARHVASALDGDELVGLVGLSTREAPYRGGVMDISWDPRQLHGILGWLGAAWAQWGTRLARHRPAADELYIDGLAVASHARGQGVGTRLLAEADAAARELGLAWVRLDVLDANPRARALYERLGFEVTKVAPLGYQGRWTGYGAMVSMQRAVDRDASPVGDAGAT